MTNKIDNVEWVWPKARRQKAMANWTWVREKTPVIDELPWVRVEELAKLKLPEPIVLVTGAFDLMHAPHMRLLFTARERAGRNGTVLVAMNSDDSVRRRKGAGRPIMTFAERASAIAYMPVDVLVEFDEESELKRLATLVNVTCQVAGSEYWGKQTTAGAPLMCIRDGGPHTSSIIDRIGKVQEQADLPPWSTKGRG